MQRVTREIVIDAPIPTIWRHLADPARRRGWFGGDLDVELRPGREGRFVTAGGTHPVRVDDVDQGRSVTFTWGEDDTASRVTIELEKAGDASRVRVTEIADADVGDHTDDVDVRDGSADTERDAEGDPTTVDEGAPPSLPADPVSGGEGSEGDPTSVEASEGDPTSVEGSRGDPSSGEPVASVIPIAAHVRHRWEIDPPAHLPEVAPAREAIPLVTPPWARAA